MNPERLQFLVSAYFDGALTPEQKSELEHALRSSAAARAQYWDHGQLHDHLRTLIEDTELAERHHSAHTRKGTPSSRSNSSWKTLLHRPVATLAAGVIVSALCTSAVWAYAGQRMAAREKSIPLLSTNFEDIADIPANGVPTKPHTWSGDYSTLTGPEQGVLPHSGKKMLRFLRADNALTQKSSPNYVAEAIHVIDLRPYRAVLVSGNAEVDIAGWFVSASAATHPQIRFLLKAASFAGNPEEAPNVWDEFSRVCLSMVQRQIEPDPTPGRWRRHSINLPIAANADFLVFECAVMQVYPAVRTGTVEFTGHYLDDVTAHLRPGAHASASLTKLPPR